MLCMNFVVQSHRSVHSNEIKYCRRRINRMGGIRMCHIDKELKTSDDGF